MKRLFVVLMLCICFSGCGKSEVVDGDDAFKVEDGELQINKNQLSTSPSYINYDADGTTVQLIALIASDDTYRVSLNTCQVCSPSPYAYFSEENGELFCHNCGNTFSYDEVGTSSTGCVPLAVAYDETSDYLSISTDVLDSYKSAFFDWAGLE